MDVKLKAKLAQTWWFSEWLKDVISAPRHLVRVPAASCTLELKVSKRDPIYDQPGTASFPDFMDLFSHLNQEWRFFIYIYIIM